MEKFKGFDRGSGSVRLPEQFFTLLLPSIDDIDELKVTLYCLWRVQVREGDLLYLKEDEILSDQDFVAGFSESDDDSPSRIKKALERAVSRGSLLMTKTRGERSDHILYFANTERSLQAIRGLQSGLWDINDSISSAISTAPRESIFSVYEHNMGPLTPLLAENLYDLVDEYTEAAVVEAISIAVRNNARRLSYVEAILKRWMTDGRNGERGDPNDYRRYRKSKYGDEIET